jgi:hypothetical protein
MFINFPRPASGVSAMSSLNRRSLALIAAAIAFDTSSVAAVMIVVHYSTTFAICLLICFCNDNNDVGRSVDPKKIF